MIEKVLEIKNSSLIASNLPLIEKKQSCLLTVDSNVGATTLTVDSVTNLQVGKYAILGDLGNPDTEIVRIHTSTAPADHTITLNAATTFDHPAGTIFTIVDYNQIEFSVSETTTGTKTVLNSATAVNIQPDNEETIYDAVADADYIASTTVYVWMRWYNSANATYSDYSSTLAKAPASRSYDSLRNIGDKAMRACKETIGVTIKYDDYLDWAEDFLQELYAYKTSWKLFREIDTSLTTTNAINYVDLPSDNQSVDMITYGSNKPYLIKVASSRQWNTITSTVSSGEPIYFYLVKKRAYLFPTPDSAYTLSVTQYYQPTRITSIDSAIDITRNGLFLMSVYFQYRIYSKIGNKDSKAKEYMNKFYALLEQIAGQEENDVAGESEMIEISNYANYYDDDFDSTYNILI